jgi:hypothetical protein
LSPNISHARREMAPVAPVPKTERRGHRRAPSLRWKTCMIKSKLVWRVAEQIRICDTQTSRGRLPLSSVRSKSRLLGVTGWSCAASECSPQELVRPSLGATPKMGSALLSPKDGIRSSKCLERCTRRLTRRRTAPKLDPQTAVACDRGHVRGAAVIDRFDRAHRMPSDGRLNVGAVWRPLRRSL